jgi:hypothetical protein
MLAQAVINLEWRQTKGRVEDLHRQLNNHF